jgi:Flp pilus assembly protein TadB
MVLGCMFMFVLGFALGFLTALALLVGIALIPAVIIVALALALWFYIRHRRERRITET